MQAESTSTTPEQWIVDTIRDLDADRQRARQRLAQAKQILEELERRIQAWHSVLEDHRRSCDLPTVGEPVVREQYDFTRLGPTEIVQRWASEHDGEVRVKDLTKEVLSQGIYKGYRMAYNSLRNPLTRLDEFEQVGPGHFRLVSNGNTDKDAFQVEFSVNGNH